MGGGYGLALSCNESKTRLPYTVFSVPVRERKLTPVGSIRNYWVTGLLHSVTVVLIWRIMGGTAFDLESGPVGGFPLVFGVSEGLLGCFWAGGC